MQKAMGFNNIPIVNVRGSAYRIYFWYMSKNDAINIMNGSNFVEKRLFYNFFLLYIQMSEYNSIESADLTYYQKNRDVTLNTAKHYYENGKERLRRESRDKYRSLSEEEKNKKREYGKKIDTAICLKKKNIKRISKKLSQGKKGLNIIMNKIVF